MMAKWSEISITQIMLLAAFLPLASTTPMCGLGCSTHGSNTSGGTQSNSTDDVVATAWYPGWLCYTAMTFAFAYGNFRVFSKRVLLISSQCNYLGRYSLITGFYQRAGPSTFVSTAKQNVSFNRQKYINS
ncbi:hypothetical protein BDQ17DRAFT_1384255 [Cyathus striatus]|nr:hypothetical protein BDQ17DRAFT_1384255 [Cyathus striatus]